MSGSASYFINPRFFEKHASLTEANVLEYFKDHTDYDPRCLNSQLGESSKNIQTVVLAKKLEGFFYEVKRVGGENFTITKFHSTGSKTMPVEIFYVVENMVFRSTNFKTFVKDKVSNVAAIIGKLVSEEQELPKDA